MQFLHLVQVDPGRGRTTTASRSPTRRSRSPSTSRRSRASRRTPTSRSSSRPPATTQEDLARARQARPAVEQDPRQGHQGQGQGLRRADRGLLQQEQGALRPARAARPADRPDQDEGARPSRPRRRSRAASPGRPWPRSTRSTRPPSRRAASCRAVAKGQQEKALDDGGLQRQEGRARRPGQDAVRLLRLRGQQDHAGHRSRRSSRRRRRSSSCSPSQNQQKALDDVRQGLPRRSGRSKTECREGYVTPELQERPEGDADAEPGAAAAAAAATPQRLAPLASRG